MCETNYHGKFIVLAHGPVARAATISRAQISPENIGDCESVFSNAIKSENQSQSDTIMTKDRNLDCLNCLCVYDEHGNTGWNMTIDNHVCDIFKKILNNYCFMIILQIILLSSLLSLVSFITIGKNLCDHVCNYQHLVF